MIHESLESPVSDTTAGKVQRSNVFAGQRERVDKTDDILICGAEERNTLEVPPYDTGVQFVHVVDVNRPQLLASDDRNQPGPVLGILVQHLLPFETDLGESAALQRGKVEEELREKRLVQHEVGYARDLVIVIPIIPDERRGLVRDFPFQLRRCDGGSHDVVGRLGPARGFARGVQMGTWDMSAPAEHISDSLHHARLQIVLIVVIVIIVVTVMFRIGLVLSQGQVVDSFRDLGCRPLHHALGRHGSPMSCDCFQCQLY